jgi:DNA polymerase-3 subunit epsilon
MKFIALDFETANFKRHSVCSIGLVVIENFKVTNTYNQLIKPNPFYFENINKSIHGITPEMTENAPSFAETWEEIRPLINNQQVVAHNASFDISALRAALEASHINFPELEYFCSMLLSKRVFPGLLNYQLPTVCKQLDISDLNHHDALSDALASANIMTKIFQHENATSFEELERLLKFTPGKVYQNAYNPFSCYVSVVKPNRQLFEIDTSTTKIDKDHPFYDKQIVFTGAITNLSRNEAKKIAESIGAKTKPETLSSKTNYLVVGTYDFSQFGEGFKSGKLKKAEKLIEEGHDLEIISELDFLRMIHSESTSFEIKIEQIESDSESFLKRNKYNDFSGKTVYFSTDLSIERTEAFQHVGNCSGYGHDYDTEVIPLSDYFVISNKIINDLKKGIKNKSLLDFEQIRNSGQNRGGVNSIKLISESTFLEYIERRIRFQKGEFKMRIHELEIE